MVPGPRTALVLGGNSDIAHAVLRRIPLEKVVLAARDGDALRRRLDAERVPIRASPTCEVTIEPWDALDSTAHERLLERAADMLGEIDLVLCAVGSLGHGAGIAANVGSAAALIESNFTGPATALTAATHRLVGQGHGIIVVLSSVAGLRARRSNYLYGSAKAGLDAFTQGLADSVTGTGVRVHLIRPGFVTSKMTTGLKPAPFATTTEAVAEAIARTVSSPRSRTVHVPAVLGPMFGAIRLLPRPVWRRIAGDR